MHKMDVVVKLEAATSLLEVYQLYLDGYIYHNLVAMPSGKFPFNWLHTYNLGQDDRVAPEPIDQLTIAYRRSANIGNLLSYHKNSNRGGAAVSSFIG